MQADPDRKVEFEPQKPTRRSIGEFFVDVFIGFFKIFVIPFRWLNGQMKLVIDDKMKLDKFKRWSRTQQRREKRRLRLNNEF